MNTTYIGKYLDSENTENKEEDNGLNLHSEIQSMSKRIRQLEDKNRQLREEIKEAEMQRKKIHDETKIIETCYNDLKSLFESGNADVTSVSEILSRLPSTAMHQTDYGR